MCLTVTAEETLKTAAILKHEGITKFLDIIRSAFVPSKCSTYMLIPNVIQIRKNPVAVVIVRQIRTWTNA